MPPVEIVVPSPLATPRTVTRARGEDPGCYEWMAYACAFVAIVHDWRRRGRAHPVYLITGALLLVVQLARLPLSRSAAWLAMTGWMVG